MLSNQSRRFTAIHLPLGIDAQTLSHETTQLSRDDEAEWLLSTVGLILYRQPV